MLRIFRLIRKAKRLIFLVVAASVFMLGRSWYFKAKNTAQTATREIKTSIKQVADDIAGTNFSDYLKPSGSLAGLSGPYDVSYVIDGDTCCVNIDGTDTIIRMLGVDTPESVHEDASRNCEEGKIASEHTKAILKNQTVWLEYGKQRTDEYGRTLAYIYLNDASMLNARLLAEGYAKELLFTENSEYAEYFDSCVKIARENNAGFWDNGVWKGNN